MQLLLSNQGNVKRAPGRQLKMVSGQAFVALELYFHIWIMSGVERPFKTGLLLGLEKCSLVGTYYS
jgi:hypothetical protein